jgi:hypothetical protein
LKDEVQVKLKRRRAFRPGSYSWLIRNMDLVLAKCAELFDQGRHIDSVLHAVAKHFGIKNPQDIEVTVQAAESHWRARRRSTQRTPA